MKYPVQVTVDPECALGYIRYLDESTPFDGSLPLFRDPDGVVRDRAFCDVDYRWEGVLIDVTADDDIIAFEILDIDDPKLLAMACDYARDNDLAFPADIRAAAVRNPAA
ncbi:MAG: hypothetical protein QOJ39_3788 [Candidatus Eremiobacteraeota bacterium]|jgi:hypothetical protein|nr:hypothetical protein [Candidatus Eremiobacteraeota bacterium]